MSAAAKPRNPLMTYLLFGVVVYTGMLLFFPPRPTDTRSAAEIWTEMQKLNADGRDVTIARVLADYQRKLDEEKGQKKLTQAQVDQKVLEANVLVAHTKLKSGLYQANEKKDGVLGHQKITAGYTLFQPKFDRYRGTTLWQTPVPVSPGFGLEGATITPDRLYQAYVEDLQVRNKDQLVFGLFRGWHLIDSLIKATGSIPGFSYWFSAFLLALVVRLAVFPLAMKQFKWGRQMGQLQPYMKEIQEKFQDKKTKQVPPEKAQAFQMETMALYKEYGVNPLSGCLPALIQLPFFLGVYNCMLLYKFEFTKGTFLWIQPGAQNLGPFQIAPNLGQVDHILVLLYAVSMIASMLLTPASDPSQIKTQRIMAVVMSVIVTVFMFMFPVPSAFVLYWVFANVLATAHALWVYRMPIEPLKKVATATGGAIPVDGFSRNGNGNGASNGSVDPEFFGKTGSPRKSKRKK